MGDNISFNFAKKIKVHTCSERETEHLGNIIASCLEGKEIIFLIGELGSGKTVLTRGIAIGSGVYKKIRSSSFVLLSQYKGERFQIYHVDLYRASKEDLLDIGFDELVDNGIIIVEWGDKAGDLLKPSIMISIDISGERDRNLIIEGEDRIINCLEGRIRKDAHLSDRYILV